MLTRHRCLTSISCYRNISLFNTFLCVNSNTKRWNPLFLVCAWTNAYYRIASHWHTNTSIHTVESTPANFIAEYMHKNTSVAEFGLSVSDFTLMKIETHTCTNNNNTASNPTNEEKNIQNATPNKKRHCLLLINEFNTFFMGTALCICASLTA